MWNHFMLNWRQWRRALSLSRFSFFLSFFLSFFFSFFISFFLSFFLSLPQLEGILYTTRLCCRGGISSIVSLNIKSTVSHSVYSILQFTDPGQLRQTIFICICSTEMCLISCCKFVDVAMKMLEKCC